MSPQPAIFLDRDGTIIADTGYISRREDVSLLEGAALAIARINEAGVPLIVVTNQSGIGRGKYTEADYENVNKRLPHTIARTRPKPSANAGNPAPSSSGRRRPSTTWISRARGTSATGCATSSRRPRSVRTASSCRGCTPPPPTS
jgi:HAD superfamily hydrolase (TIGR01662 family)